MKYQPKNTEELRDLIKDENIYLGDIDISLITDMACAFYQSKRKDFTGLEKWDVSKVRNMRWMFYNCPYFNQNINNWDVSNVTNMWAMFCNCRSFNQPLNNWNVSKVKNMSQMFEGCIEFNQPLNNWNVSKVTNMEYMFYKCKNFNQPLDNWNLSKVKKISNMFAKCYLLIETNIPKIPHNIRTWWYSIELVERVRGLLICMFFFCTGFSIIFPLIMFMHYYRL